MKMLPCVVNYPREMDATNHMDLATALVRTSYLATLDAGAFDDDALGALRETLFLALTSLDALSGWARDMHNGFVDEEWKRAEREGRVSHRQTEKENA